MSKTQKVFADPSAQIERIKIEGRDFVLMREKIYFDLLQKIESLDSALDLQRSESEANLNIAGALLRGGYAPAQIDAVLAAPTLGRRVELLRRYGHMNQEQLARKAGVSQTTVSNLENEKISFRTLTRTGKVLSALGVPYEDYIRFIIGGQIKARKKNLRDFVEVDFSSPSVNVDPSKVGEK
ncbi:MAG: helix-turn-helix transcriptional regulator [Candidatus Binataceae bacterium]